MWRDSTVQDFLDVKSVEIMKKTIESDILVWPIKSSIGSIYIFKQCLTNLISTKQHEHQLKQISFRNTCHPLNKPLTAYTTHCYKRNCSHLFCKTPFPEVKLGLIETKINICVQMTNLFACSKDSLFDFASIRKTNLQKSLSLLHFNSAHRNLKLLEMHNCALCNKSLFINYDSIHNMPWGLFLF